MKFKDREKIAKFYHRMMTDVVNSSGDSLDEMSVDYDSGFYVGCLAILQEFFLEFKSNFPVKDQIELQTMYDNEKNSKCNACNSINN